MASRLRMILLVLLPLLALIGQVAAGAALPADLDTALAASVIDCAAPAQAPTQPGAPHHHHAPDGVVLCPLSLAVALPALLPAGPTLPGPTIALIGEASLPPPARAPPLPARRLPPPRAPPAAV